MTRTVSPTCLTSGTFFLAQLTSRPDSNGTAMVPLHATTNMEEASDGKLSLIRLEQSGKVAQEKFRRPSVLLASQRRFNEFTKR